MPSTLYWISTSSTDPSVGANWSTGSAPVTGDTVYIVPIQGLSLAAIGAYDHSAVTLAAMYISAGYTGTIGTTSAYWQISSTLLYLGTPIGGSGSAAGSGRIKLNLGTVQSTIYVYSTAAVATESTGEPIRIKGTHASNKIYMLGSGRVGVATDVPGEVATISEWDVTGNGTLNLGAGCTLTTGYQTQGTVNIGSAMTTITQTGGTLNTAGTAAITTISVGGTVVSSSSGTITTANLYGTGKLDLSQNPAARTVSTLNHYKGGQLILPAANPGAITLTTYNKLQGSTLILN